LLLAILERHSTPIAAVQIKQIERVVEHGNIRIRSAPTASGTEAGSLLHQAERRSSLLVERNHFAIEDGILCLDELR
jgi:hypothetical protein